MKGQLFQIVLTITVGYIICVDAQSKGRPMKKPIDLSTNESQSYTTTTDDESEMIKESTTDTEGPQGLPNQDIDQDLHSHNEEKGIPSGHNTTDEKQMFNESSPDIKGPQVVPSQDIVKEYPSEYEQESNPSGHNTTDEKQMFNESSPDIKGPQVLSSQDIVKEYPSEYEQESNPSDKNIGFKTGIKALTDGCARGTRVGSQCLTFSAEKLNWENAVIVCKALGGRLVVLDDIPEPFELLAYTVRNYDRTFFWLGATRDVREGTWIWQGTNEKFDEVIKDNLPWGEEQPNDQNGNQDCLFLGHQRGFGDELCTRKHRFICEFGIYN